MRRLLGNVRGNLRSGALALLLASCSAGGSGGPGTVPAGGSSNDGAGGGSGNSAGGSSGSTGELPPGPETDPTALCGESAAGPPGLRRLSRRELENTLRDVFPSLGASWTSTLSADTISESGFDNDEGMLLVSKQTAREVAETAEVVASNVTGALQQLLPCAATTPDQSCVEQLLDAQGRRLFRRPLSEAERQAFLGFFNTALTATNDFTQSTGWLIRALIESPEFLYRRELGTANGDVVQLNQYEIAAELAYTYSGTAPTDELLDRASRGELNSKEVLIETARNLLLSAGRSVIENFFDSYVGHSRVTTIAKAGVQNFADRRGEMLQETRRFIEEVVFTRNGGVRELLTASFTTPSRQLATFYQFGAQPAADYEVFERPADRGIGLLAQGAVLATLSQPNGSSPTKRGLWIHKHLLCNTVPMVPPNIPELDPPAPGARTTRQRYAEDHAQGSCQMCHSRWDPIGFGFEHFDEAGRYRPDEGGLPIDTSSFVPEQGVDFTRAPDPAKALFEFDGQEDLMTQLVELPVVSQCMSGYMATYAFGGPLTCAAETRRAEFIAGELGFIDYLASMAGEPQFTERRVEPAP